MSALGAADSRPYPHKQIITRYCAMPLMKFSLGTRVLSGTTLLVAILAAGIGHAQDTSAGDRPVQTVKPSEVSKVAPANQYCANIADAAADARFAWQKQTLAALEKDIEERIKLLEQKRAEYEEWLRKRNEFLARADESVVAIYSRMRPDAAATQLANMHDETAAAILAKLNPRSASAVLNEMEPARAAQLTNLLTDKPNRTQSNEKSG